MKSFFESEERIKALRFHAAELIDTPFAAHAMVPGVGIDCVHVNAWCYLKTGLLGSFEPPAYQLDEGSHTEPQESKLIKWLRGAIEFRELEFAEPRSMSDQAFVCARTVQAGDTLCFDTGKSEFHVGLLLDRQHFVHVLAMQRGRVIVSDLLKELYYLRRLRSAFRPVSPN